MSESVPSRPVRPLAVRELVMLTVAIVSVAAVSFGLGYVTGRDRGAGIVHDERRGFDADRADERLAELLAQIEVSDAVDKGLSELTYPEELRGRPQERRRGLEVDGFAIDLGEVPEARVADLRRVLAGRLVPAYTVQTVEGTSRMFVGGYASSREAAAWLPIVDSAVTGLGLPEPTVVRDPRQAEAP